MLGTTPEDLAQFLHQEERLDSVKPLFSPSLSAPQLLVRREIADQKPVRSSLRKRLRIINSNRV